MSPRAASSHRIEPSGSERANYPRLAAARVAAPRRWAARQANARPSLGVVRAVPDLVLPRLVEVGYAEVPVGVRGRLHYDCYALVTGLGMFKYSGGINIPLRVRHRMPQALTIVRYFPRNANSCLLVVYGMAKRTCHIEAIRNHCDESMETKTGTIIIKMYGYIMAHGRS